MNKLLYPCIILGIDPGSRATGFGVIKVTEKQTIYLTSGCIRLSSPDMALRLQQLFNGLREVIAEYAPHESAIEQVFMHKNPGSALKLGQARGVAMVAASLDISVAEYSARQIKQSVVGYGAAKKEQVQHMVKVLLNLQGTLQADAADALAVAICHAYTRQSIGRLPTGIRRFRRRRLRSHA